MAMRYQFIIPIDQWDNYIKYIITRIYGSQENQCVIEGDHGNDRYIHLDVNPQVPLINSLPFTICETSDVIHCTNATKVAATKAMIDNGIRDEFHLGSRYYHSPKSISMDTTELKAIVWQLARQRDITKFIELTHGQFLIAIQPYIMTLLLRVANNQLEVNIYQSCTISPFDVDDGYDGILSCLNPAWHYWLQKGDITAEIHQSNHV